MTSPIKPLDNSGSLNAHRIQKMVARRGFVYVHVVTKRQLQVKISAKGVRNPVDVYVRCSRSRKIPHMGIAPTDDLLPTKYGPPCGIAVQTQSTNITNITVDAELKSAKNGCVLKTFWPIWGSDQMVSLLTAKKLMETTSQITVDG